VTRYGYDCSHYDWDRHTVSCSNARNAGISLMTHKATENTGYTDARFDDWAAQAKTAGFAVAGSYHVLWPGSITDQVDHWLGVVDAKAPWWRDHPCWIWQIDCEIFQNMPRSPNRAEIQACGDLIVARTGCAPTQVIAYAPNWVYGGTLAGLTYRLWSSAYVGSGPYKTVYTDHGGDNGKGWAPYSGQTPLVWQYSSTTTIGSQPECDANAIRVSTDMDLQDLFKGGDMTVTDTEIASIASAVWAKGVKNDATGIVQPAGARLVGAQAQTALNADVDAAKAAIAALDTAIVSGFAAVANSFEAVAQQVAQLQAAVATLQPGTGGGGPANVSLTGTITPT
jgi:hypothetical protein